MSTALSTLHANHLIEVTITPANQIFGPDKIERTALSAAKKLEVVQAIFTSIDSHDIACGAGEYIEENGSDRLRDLAAELRQVADVLADCMNHYEVTCAENSLELACRY